MEKEIKNDLLITEGENLKVKIPSINCILGDKLTAFAPHTTGILLNTGKDMEVMKQMYDVHTLLNKFDDFDIKRCVFGIKYLYYIPKGFLNCQLLIVNYKQQFIVLPIFLSSYLPIFR